MKKEYQVLEGKTFTVDLLSYTGSTNYAWCLSELPKEIVLLSVENVPAGGINDATTVQRFYFGVVSSDVREVTIEFTLNCCSEISESSETFTAKVIIIPKDDFVPFSENDYSKLITAYAYPNTKVPGIPARSMDSQFPAMDYGFPECTQDTNLIYGVSCGVQQDANLKYGYPCGVQDANLKYGYPCGVQDANMKYGYPCREYTKDMRPYGVPYWE